MGGDAEPGTTGGVLKEFLSDPALLMQAAGMVVPNVYYTNAWGNTYPVAKPGALLSGLGGTMQNLRAQQAKETGLRDLAWKMGQSYQDPYDPQMQEYQFQGKLPATGETAGSPTMTQRAQGTKTQPPSISNFLSGLNQEQFRALTQPQVVGQQDIFGTYKGLREQEDARLAIRKGQIWDAARQAWKTSNGEDPDANEAMQVLMNDVSESGGLGAGLAARAQSRDMAAKEIMEKNLIDMAVNDLRYSHEDAVRMARQGTLLQEVNKHLTRRSTMIDSRAKIEALEATGAYPPSFLAPLKRLAETGMVITDETVANYLQRAPLAKAMRDFPEVFANLSSGIPLTGPKGAEFLQTFASQYPGAENDLMKMQAAAVQYRLHERGTVAQESATRATEANNTLMRISNLNQEIQAQNNAPRISDEMWNQNQRNGVTNTQPSMSQWQAEMDLLQKQRSDLARMSKGQLAAHRALTDPEGLKTSLQMQIGDPINVLRDQIAKGGRPSTLGEIEILSKDLKGMAPYLNAVQNGPQMVQKYQIELQQLEKDVRTTADQLTMHPDYYPPAPPAQSWEAPPTLPLSQMPPGHPRFGEMERRGAEETAKAQAEVNRKAQQNTQQLQKGAKQQPAAKGLQKPWGALTPQEKALVIEQQRGL